MYTLDDLKAEFRLTASGDAWSNTMQWLFGIADEIYFNRDDIEVPDEWGYNPGAAREPDPDNYMREFAAEIPDAVLIEFGAKLWRLRGILKAMGRDY